MQRGNKIEKSKKNYLNIKNVLTQLLDLVEIEWYLDKKQFFWIVNEK